MERTIATLPWVREVPTGDGTDLPPLKTAEASSLANTLMGIYKKAGASPVRSTSDVVVVYVSRLSAALVHNKNIDNGEWQSLSPYLALVTSSPNRLRSPLTSWSRQVQAIGSQSGVWKMKLALARAMLSA